MACLCCCRYEARNGRDGRIWRHENLRLIVGADVRSSHGGLSVLCESGRLHVYYVDADSEIHELIRWGKWSDNHIHSIVKAGPAPSAVQLGGAFHDTFHLGLVYKAADGVNYKLYVSDVVVPACHSFHMRPCSLLVCFQLSVPATTHCSRAGDGEHCLCQTRTATSCRCTSCRFHASARLLRAACAACSGSC